MPQLVRGGYTSAGTGTGSGSVFRIEPVKAARGDDDSEIECVADNGIGDAAVATARLHVYSTDVQRTYIYVIKEVTVETKVWVLENLN
jgi:hypothetical protein